MPAASDWNRAFSVRAAEPAEKSTADQIPVPAPHGHACGDGRSDLEDDLRKTGISECGTAFGRSSAGGRDARLYGDRGVFLGAGVQLHMEEPGLYDGTLAGGDLFGIRRADGSCQSRRRHKAAVFLVCDLSQSEGLSVYDHGALFSELLQGVPGSVPGGGFLSPREHVPSAASV